METETVEKELSEKQVKYITMRNQGLTQIDAAKVAGFSIESVSYLSRNLEKKRDIFTLSDAKRARKSVRLMIAGQPVGESGPPKPSDVLRAAETILDRTHPAVQRIESNNVSVHLRLSDEERAAYLAALQSELAPQPIDITPSDRQ